VAFYLSQAPEALPLLLPVSPPIADKSFLRMNLISAVQARLLITSSHPSRHPQASPILSPLVNERALGKSLSSSTPRSPRHGMGRIILNLFQKPAVGRGSNQPSVLFLCFVERGFIDADTEVESCSTPRSTDGAHQSMIISAIRFAGRQDLDVDQGLLPPAGEIATG